MTSHVWIRLAIAGFVLTVPFGAAASAQAQGDTAATQAAAVNRPSVKRVPIAKSVFGDAGMIVNARDDGFIEVAAAGPSKTVLLQLRTMAARAWVDSTARMLRARVRRSNTPRTYRSDIDEAGTSTTMALTRKVTAGESQYALFFSDDPLGGFTIPIERSEADVFVAQVRRAVALSAKLLEPSDSTKPADSAAKAKKPAPKPATRRTTRPPATQPAPKSPSQPSGKATTPA
ncbi:MAG: hypothetical protein K0S86_4720 [Geminicoccaceae bacterium]|nr:hypothetical protein [Geminicoccaceae bacterium]